VNSFYETVEAREELNPERMFDGRARYYLDGWDLFLNNKINGIGLTNFMYYDIRSRALHTEYMAQLAEGGLIGTLLFLLFYSYIIISLFKIRKNKSLKKSAEAYLLSMIIMLILFTGVWIYRNPMMWVLIGLSIRFIFENKSSLKTIKLQNEIRESQNIQ
jgi:O-antigen ligase